MNKKQLTEADIRTKFITPAIVGADGRKWDLHRQVREEVYFTAGRVIVRGKRTTRGKARKADYVLSWKPNLPLAVVEAKDNHHTVADGMQQALDYAETLDVPFAYSSNGDAFLEHDRTATDGSGPVTREIPLADFPSADEFWRRYRASRGFTDESARLATQDYHDDGSGREPRYYQRIAINRCVDAIARGDDRLLLTMATGTGKTYTAFQIIWRLWRAGAKKRILFLVDRNILANQTMIGDFKPFKSSMCKLSASNHSIQDRDGNTVVLPSGVKQDRTVDKSYEVYLCLYQAVTGTDESQNLYKQFSPDFFDLVVIDECHRGSAADDAAWRQILEHFTSATQIGLTATPKETKDVSNTDYFGEAVYTYSLRQGIDDGFLAPYKVVRIGLDKDLDGWRPELGKTDDGGQLIEDREYNDLDYDRSLVLDQRTRLVAAKVTEFLKATDRFAKTIVFCENIDHAERMRMALVEQNADLAAANSRYVMRITGDNAEGKAQLDNFIDPESVYPVIACTSRLMSTGVDAQTCRLIVLDRRIGSMTEFKQIIGRGTRINEDHGKLFFTIMDFKRATALFADEDFDGDPVVVYEPDADDPPVPPEGDDPDAPDLLDADGFPVEADGDWANVGDGDAHPGEVREPRRRYVVGDVPVRVATERVQYLDAGGKLITESLRDYSRRAVLSAYDSLEHFLTAWNAADRKQAILEELCQRGVFLDELAASVGPEYDAFDLVCHVAFDRPPLTRRERADDVQKRDVFAKHGGDARGVLDALLAKYADSGIGSVESLDILKVDPLSGFGTPIEVLRLFGGKPAYLAAVRELGTALYEDQAG